MTELEKLEAGLEYSFWDKEVNARKQHAMVEAAKLNAIDPQDEDAISAQLKNCSVPAEMIPGQAPALTVIMG